MSNVINITRDDLVAATVDRLMSSTSIEAVMHDKIKEVMREHALISIDAAAKMMGYETARTFRRTHPELIRKLGTKLHRVKLGDVLALSADD